MAGGLARVPADRKTGWGLRRRTAAGAQRSRPESVRPLNRQFAAGSQSSENSAGRTGTRSIPGGFQSGVESSKIVMSVKEPPAAKAKVTPGRTATLRTGRGRETGTGVGVMLKAIYAIAAAAIVAGSFVTLRSAFRRRSKPAVRCRASKADRADARPLAGLLAKCVAVFRSRLLARYAQHVRTGPRGMPAPMIVLIDNYDSFTFNLVHYLGELGAEVRVHRNDKITSAAVVAADPDAIVLSPGPCTPKEAGICLDLIAAAFPQNPDPRRLPRPSGDRRRLRRQGGARAGAGARQAVEIRHDGTGIFRGINAPFQATRYHSLVVDRAACPRTDRDRGHRGWPDHGTAHAGCRCTACNSIPKASPPTTAT
jgi:hypothetical protein